MTMLRPTNMSNSAQTSILHFHHLTIRITCQIGKNLTPQDELTKVQLQRSSNVSIKQRYCSVIHTYKFQQAISKRPHVTLTRQCQRSSSAVSPASSTASSVIPPMLLTDWRLHSHLKPSEPKLPFTKYTSHLERKETKHPTQSTLFLLGGQSIAYVEVHKISRLIIVERKRQFSCS